MGLDYRVIGVREKPLKILRVIDIITMTDVPDVYERIGYIHKPNVPSSWLLIHQHKNLVLPLSTLMSFLSNQRAVKIAHKAI